MIGSGGGRLGRNWSNSVISIDVTISFVMPIANRTLADTLGGHSRTLAQGMQPFLACPVRVTA
jgi:hypothetical protein